MGSLPNPSLNEQLGGEAAVIAAVDVFFLSNHRISHFFDDVDMDRQIAKREVSGRWRSAVHGLIQEKTCVLAYLGTHPDRVVTTHEISAAYGKSKNHLVRVVQTPAAHWYVQIHTGYSGGVLLRASPKRFRWGT